MSDIADINAALKIIRREDGVGRRRRAEDDYEPARAVARQFGFELVRYNSSHFQLRDGAYIVNLYPGNQRVVRLLKGKRGGEFIPLPSDRDWTLGDVVAAYAEVLRT